MQIIFPSQNEIDKELANTTKLVNKTHSLKGKIHGMNEKEINELLDLYEEITLKIRTLEQYPNLRIEANANDKEAIKLLNSITQQTTNWRKQLAFILLELGKWLNETPQLITKQELSHRKFFLQRVKDESEYKLSEAEEVLILEKDRNGVNQWAQLQGELLGKSQFNIKVKGEIQKHSWNSGYGLITNHEHEVRKAALIGLGKGLEEKAEIYAYAFRNLAANYVSESKKRGYKDYLASSLSASHLNSDIVDVMFEVLIENKSLFQEFLNIKAKLLGSSKLRGEDLESPLPFTVERKISWNEAKEIVIGGFTDFDTEFGNIASDMFANNRVDAAVRDGKGSGAFCSSWYPGKSAFIKMGYSETLDSVATLAHEMGHAVHAYLSIENQPFMNTQIGMPIAETASEFGSLLFNLKFMKEAQNETERKSVLFEMVQNFMIVMFEVGSRKLFEQKVYEAIDRNEFLDVDLINTLFWEARKEIFGDAIEWLPEQAYHWCWKPHYYSPRFRFYNYPYVFGEFSVLSLYAAYRKDSTKFTKNFKEFLKAGSSKHPQEMFMELFGFDLSSKSFWQTGMDELKQFVDQCKSYL